MEKLTKTLRSVSAGLTWRVIILKRKKVLTNTCFGHFVLLQNFNIANLFIVKIPKSDREIDV